MAIREIYHDAGTIQHYVERGEWSHTTLDDSLQQHARERGDKLAIVDRRWRLTYAELDRLARRVACGLRHLGLESGDVISIQLPNWAEWLIHLRRDARVPQSAADRRLEAARAPRDP